MATYTEAKKKRTIPSLFAIKESASASSTCGHVKTSDVREQKEEAKPGKSTDTASKQNTQTIVEVGAQTLRKF